MSRRLLITGGTGLAGSNIALLARSRGWDVRVMVRNDPGYPAFVEAGIEVVVGDVTERESLRAALEGVTHVVHAAASVAGTWSRATPESHDAVNHLGGIALLDALADSEVTRTVWIDTVSILDTSFTLTERSPVVELTAPASPYVVSKTKSYYEAMYRAALGRHIAFVTPGCIYGPGPFPERVMDPASFTATLHRGITGGIGDYVTFPMFWTYVGDLAEICLRALERGERGRRYLSIGRDEDVSSLAAFCNEGAELAGSVHRVTEIDPRAEGGPDIGTMKQFALREYATPYLDNSATTAELDYALTPRHEALAITVRWLRDNALL